MHGFLSGSTLYAHRFTLNAHRSKLMLNEMHDLIRDFMSPSFAKYHSASSVASAPSAWICLPKPQLSRLYASGSMLKPQRFTLNAQRSTLNALRLRLNAFSSSPKL